MRAIQILIFSLSLPLFATVDPATVGQTSRCFARLYANKIAAALPIAKPDGWAARKIANSVEDTDSARFVATVYVEAQERARNGENFVSALARAMGVANIDPALRAKVPRTGSLIVGANHPFGLPDGIAAYEFYDSIRPGEVLGMATTAVADFMPEFADHMLLINIDTVKNGDVEGRRRQVMNNALAARRALDWLEQGRVLCLFPAGATSRRKYIFSRQASERTWKDGLVTLARISQSPVQLMHVHGSNTRVSDALAWLGEDVPLLARAWETHRRAQQPPFQVDIADPIPYAQFPQELSDTERTRWLFAMYSAFAGGQDIAPPSHP